jgi:hypothetical protein
VLTSSIVLAMIVNTVAASTAAFVALLSSALETEHRVTTTDVPKVQPGFPTAAFRTRRSIADAAEPGWSQGTFSLVGRSAASGRIRNHNDEPDGELLRRMT